MALKVIYILNDNTQNYPLRKFWWRRLDTQLNESTNQNLMKVLKVVEPKNFGVQCNKQPYVPFLPGNTHMCSALQILLSVENGYKHGSQ